MIPMSPMSAVVSMTAMSVMPGVRFVAGVSGVGVVVTGVGRIIPVVACGGQRVGDLSGVRRHPLPVGGLAPMSIAVGGVALGGTASIWLRPAMLVMVLRRTHWLPLVDSPRSYPYRVSLLGARGRSGIQFPICSQGRGIFIGSSWKVDRLARSDGRCFRW